MNAGQRQVIAEKIGSTVRMLELVGFHDYEVTSPRNQRKGGNASPRVVRVNIGQKNPLRIYNGTRGSTWANGPDGEPIRGIVHVDDLYNYFRALKNRQQPRKRKKAR